ncbi:AmmeMemoRadiSam system radical SAM enzyme [Candidatus Peregrinibacteria bacterium CG08_land_8_20_14_0_20_41_10]|nr:MAG: AmmeMemoRadiSam system radical SAM enzyme [Candidatus Peregrinibacteria bacterium CG08_land_8_20_14_0_20_41_10]
MHKAALYKQLEDQRVQCLACSHYCKIPEGRRGICGVRENQKGKLYLLVYGYPAAVNLDPIEKKPLFHFLPGSRIFSLGTEGCNFKCAFCQNWEISQKIKNSKFKNQNFSEGLEEWEPEKIVQYCVESKIPSIAYTYNEPAVFFEYAFDTAKLARAAGLQNVYVSNGYESSEALKKIAPFLDAINLDLKSFSAAFYQKICGGKLEVVLENIQRIKKLKIWQEITTLVIPGQNDSALELKQIAEFIANINPAIPWHVSRFFPAYQMLEVPPTSVTKLKEAYTIGKRAGLKYVYLGNLEDEVKSSTYCPDCGALVIKRSSFGFEVENLLRRGNCPYCGREIEGVFN